MCLQSQEPPCCISQGILSSSINQIMQATIWCSAFSNCLGLGYLLPYVWIFSSAFFFTSFIFQNFFPMFFPQSNLLRGYIRIVQGELKIALCQSAKIALSHSFYSEKLVPCLFIQELYSTLLVYPLSVTGLLSFSLGFLDNLEVIP